MYSLDSCMYSLVQLYVQSWTAMMDRKAVRNLYSVVPNKIILRHWCILLVFTVEAYVIFEMAVNNHKRQSLQLLKREAWCANLCTQGYQLSLHARTQHRYAVRPGDNAAQRVAFWAASIKHFYAIQRRTAASVYRYCSTENGNFTALLSWRLWASTTLRYLTLSCDVWRQVVEWGVPDVSMECTGRLHVQIKLSLLGGLNTAAPLWEPQKSQPQVHFLRTN